MSPGDQRPTSSSKGMQVIPLPAPMREGRMSVEQAMAHRRSRREYRATPLSLATISQLLWAAQGVTDPRGRRTAPSAGALYPLEVYLLAGEVEGLPPGVYHYDPRAHALSTTLPGDQRSELARAALDQMWLADAPVVLVFTAVYARTIAKYGRRGRQYVHMDAGCAAQNVYLQAEALGLGTVFVGAFHDARVQAVLALSEQETPLVIMPVGRT